MNMRLPMRGDGAFTMMELLVTITIVAVLASLSIAAVGKVQEMSRRTKCVGNLKQWGVALLQYTGDHDGSIPRRGQGVRMVTVLDRPEDWFNALPPYMNQPSLTELKAKGALPAPGDQSVFVCPSATQGQEGAQVFLSYGMNMNLSPWNLPATHNLTTLASPAQLAFLADSPGGYASTIPASGAYSVEPRHGGHACVAFCDGHVKAFPGDYLGCHKDVIDHDDVRWAIIPAASP